MGWEPVPREAWPISNGVPWTGQEYRAYAQDLDTTNPAIFLCDGSRHETWVTASQARPLFETGCVFRNLPLGRTYNVTVIATVTKPPWHFNTAGRGDLLSEGGVTMCCSLPGAPQDVRMIDIGNRKAVVDWSPPGSSGGSVQLSYSVKLEPDGGTCEADQSPCEFRNLKYGVPYRAEVVAKNSSGYSPAGFSNSISLRATPPRAPRQVRARIRGESVVVRWKAPVPVNGITISRYEVVSNSGGIRCRTSKRVCVIRGVDPTISQAFTVVAVDSLNRKARSSSSRPVSFPTQPAPPSQEVGQPLKPEIPIS